MYGLFNLDEFFPISWSKKYGNRAFQFDAFISHNRNDRHSKRLAQELYSRNATVWHDDDQDIQDRKVQKAVSLALVRSRYLVLSVDDCFRDSAWCRAEYKSALETEKQAGGLKVLVAHMTPHSFVPDCLLEARSFKCYQKNEVDRLSTLLKNGNRVPFNTNWNADNQIQTFKDDNIIALCDTIIRESRDKKDINSRTLLMVALSVEGGDSLSYSQQLEKARLILINDVEMSGFSKEDFDFLVSSSLFLCGLSDPDVRANGMYILAHLADHDPTGNLRDVLLHIFKEEPVDSNLSVGFPWFEKNWALFTEEQRSIVELCALRYPSGLKSFFLQSKFVSSLSEVTRTKVFAQGLEAGILPHKESMHLIEVKVDYILASDKAVIGNSRLDELRGMLGISDMELVFIDLNTLLFDRFDGLKPEFETLAPRVVALIDHIAKHSHDHQGFPLITMEEWVLDYVLKPLLYCVSHRISKKQAEKAFNGVCNVIEAVGSLSHEVPFYRNYLKIASKGADISDGLSSECFRKVRLGMLKASQEHRSQTALQKLAQMGMVELESRAGMNNNKE